MTALIVIGCIFLFFALLFSQRIKVFIRLTDELHLRAGLGLIVLTLAPKKPRKPVDPDDFTYEKHQKRLAKEKKLADKKAEKKRRKAEKKQKAKQLAEEAAAAAELAKTAADAPEEADSHKLETILALIEFALNELPRLASAIHTEVKMLHITVGGAEADKIAKQYGILAGSVSLLLELLENKTDMKKLKPGAVTVEADFLLAKTKMEMDLSFKLSLFAIVRTGWHTLLWFIGQKLHK